MQRVKQIAIILPDTLQSTGLHALLTDYFPPVEISYFPTFESFSAVQDIFDYYFTQADIFILNADFFLPRRAKVVINICNGIPANISGYNNLNVCAPQEIIIEQLQQLFAAENATNTSGIEKNKELSSREIDVLQLIVKGITNREIADKLNISLNTVLTHRKNITAKLGIKTVSGLTFYAIMNGLVSSDFIS